MGTPEEVRAAPVVSTLVVGLSKTNVEDCQVLMEMLEQ